MITLPNKYFAFFMLSLLIFIGYSCHKSGTESDAYNADQEKISDPVLFDLDQIKKRGYLIAIVDNSSTGYFIYKGQPMGYEYDLLKLLAKHLNVRLDIKLTTNIHEAFKMLNNGEGDIIAYSLTVTKERKSIISFTDSHFNTRQMLVQRKPDGWRNLTQEELDKSLIRNQVELEGKQIYVRKHSSYIQRLKNLSQEIGGDIIIIEEPDSVETEAMIRKVANGEIDFTVADETVAYVNAGYYSDIDVNTPLSFPQQIAWGVRKNSDNLLSETNIWLKSVKRKPTFNVVFSKYFRSTRASSRRAQSDFSSFAGHRISQYDDLIKESAKLLDWDWRLLAAQMYRESHFDSNAKSWAGAMGVMQLMPETGYAYGANNLLDPGQNIKAATKYLLYIDQLWSKTIRDKNERIKFVLASYNVGLGHVEDARDLAFKFGDDPTVWDGNVEKYLKLKSKRKYFTDPIVQWGYCRGDEPVNYVREILNFYRQYKQVISS